MEERDIGEMIQSYCGDLLSKGHIISKYDIQHKNVLIEQYFLYIVGKSNSVSKLLIARYKVSK